MKRQIILAMTALCVAALLNSESAPAALAQGPVNAGPGTALLFDNRPHAIPASSDLWYSFYYAGDKSLIVMKMFDAANNRLGFDLYTSEQVARLASEDKPFGRGTAKNVDCGSDKCQSSDLTWKGATPVAGIYFIKVTNSAPKPQVFYLLIGGESVRIGAPIEDQASVQSANPPPPAPPPPPQNAGPNNLPQTNGYSICDHLQ